MNIPTIILTAISVSFTPTYSMQMYACMGSEDPVQSLYEWSGVLDAIRQVETGGQPNGGIGAKGDNGNAYGPYQIWRIYHTDAAERDKTLTDYGRCLNEKAYSEQVIRSYMNRYNREALLRLEAGTGTLSDVERIARIHNGGPKGYRKKATVKYWRKVRRNL